MTTIGTFTKAQDGAFHGTMRTLTLSVKAMVIRPSDRTAERAPDHRVYAGQLELGAAWTVTRPGKPECLAVTIDDAALPAPLHALLCQTDDGYELRWSRRKAG
ncbi:MAG: DUF736 domain-containing protein [Pseudomonadota bacterium]|nr:MAG: DUF736 domain-containing protein [Phenylobacterium zucineum]